MASFILPKSLLLLLPLLSLFCAISISEAKPSFTFGKNGSFESNDIALYGEANLLHGGSSISIQMNDSVSHNSGRVVYKKPVEFVETKSEYPAGFSTFISFSVNGGGKLGFVVFPVNGTFDQSLFEVKFGTFESNVTVSVDGSTVPEEIRSFTIANEEEEDKEMFYAWVNYIAGGKFLEVRLSKSESFEHADPVMFTRIDLSGMLKGKGDEFMVGVKSYGGNVGLHSWSLEARSVSKGVHSYGAIMVEKLREEEEEAKKRRKRARAWEIVTCFVMTFGSTGLVFFAMMHIWAAFKRNNLVKAMQEECGIKTKEFEYAKMEKMEAVMSKTDSSK